MSPFFTAWKPFHNNKRILGIQFYKTFPATAIISDFHDGEALLLLENCNEVHRS